MIVLYKEQYNLSGVLYMAPVKYANPSAIKYVAYNQREKNMNENAHTADDILTMCFWQVATFDNKELYTDAVGKDDLLEYFERTAHRRTKVDR